MQNNLIDPTSLLTKQNIADIQADARERFPKESIGIITPDGYVPFKNVHPDPENASAVNPRKLLPYRKDGTYKALIHSHPNAPFCPSAADMLAQMADDVPYGLLSVFGEACSPVALWGDQLIKADLINRYFQHAITDCYEYIRDDYWENDRIRLMQFARSWEWWSQGRDLDLYMTGFRKAGFEVVPLKDVKPRDVILFRVRSDHHNHGAIYEGNDLIRHHTASMEPYDPRKLPTTEPIYRWLKYDPVAVRPTPKLLSTAKG